MTGNAARAHDGPEPELDWSAIAACAAFPRVPFTVSDDVVDAYLEATGEQHALYEARGGFVPPLFATLVRLVKRSLGGRWPSGTIQLDHRLATFRPIRRGEQLTLDARIRNAEIRNGKAYFTTRSVMRDEAGSVVGVQESTSMWAGALAAKTQPGSRSETAPRKPVEEFRVPASRDGRFGPVSAHFPLATLRAFGSVAGALDPIHVDPAFAQATRYATNVVQGRLVMALLSRLMLERFGREWLEGNELSVRFVRPVPVDQTVHAWGAPSDGDIAAHTVWCETPLQGPVIVGSARVGGRRRAGHMTPTPGKSTTT